MLFFPVFSRSSGQKQAASASRNIITFSAAGGMYLSTDSAVSADRIVMTVYPDGNGNTGLPTGAPAVTDYEIQTIDFAYAGGTIQEFFKNGTDYFEGSALDLKVYNGPDLVLSSNLNDDLSTAVIPSTGSAGVTLTAQNMTTADSELFTRIGNGWQNAFWPNLLPVSDVADQSVWVSTGVGSPAFSSGTWTWSGGAGNVWLGTTVTEVGTTPTTGLLVTGAVNLRIISGGPADFQLITKRSDGSEINIESLSSMTSSFQRFTNAQTFSGSSGGVEFYVRYTGTGNPEIEIADPQLELGSETAYKPTTGTPGRRLEYA